MARKIKKTETAETKAVKKSNPKTKAAEVAEVVEETQAETMEVVEEAQVEATETVEETQAEAAEISDDGASKIIVKTVRSLGENVDYKDQSTAQQLLTVQQQTAAILNHLQALTQTQTEHAEKLADLSTAVSKTKSWPSILAGTTTGIIIGSAVTGILFFVFGD